MNKKTAPLSDRAIKRAARKSKTMVEFMKVAGYSADHPGSNSMRRIKGLIGKNVYNEIASHRRIGTPPNRWTKVN